MTTGIQTKATPTNIWRADEREKWPGLFHGTERNETERNVTRAIIDDFAGSETPRPSVVNGVAGVAASDEEQ